MHLYQAHHQWATRPADERFETIAALRDAVHSRRQASREHNEFVTGLRVETRGTDLVVTNGHQMTPTNWSWNQLCGLVKAPAGYLATLSAPTVAAAMNESIRRRGDLSDRLKIMRIEHDGGTVLQAITSTTYGRIWDADVVDAVAQMVDRTGGTWRNPVAYRGGQWGAPLAPSGLYASDRDVFMFLIDGGDMLDAGPRAQLHKGFMVSNSEVGKAAFTLRTFLFNTVCGNNIIWGATDVKELRIVHSSGGPSRYVRDALPTLIEYTNASPDITAIQRAQRLSLLALPTIGHHDRMDEDWTKDFSKTHGFTRAEVREAVDAANREDGQCAHLWDMVQGLTAVARTIPHVDTRLDLETRAGRLLNICN